MILTATESPSRIIVLFYRFPLMCSTNDVDGNLIVAIHFVTVGNPLQINFLCSSHFNYIKMHFFILILMWRGKSYKLWHLSKISIQNKNLGKSTRIVLSIIKYIDYKQYNVIVRKLHLHISCWLFCAYIQEATSVELLLLQPLNSSTFNHSYVSAITSPVVKDMTFQLVRSRLKVKIRASRKKRQLNLLLQLFPSSATTTNLTNSSSISYFNQTYYANILFY